MRNKRIIWLVLLTVSTVPAISMSVNAIENAASPNAATESVAESGTPIQVNLSEGSSVQPVLEPASVTADIAVRDTSESGLSENNGDAYVAAEGETRSGTNMENIRHPVSPRGDKAVFRRRAVEKVNSSPAVVDISESANSEGVATTPVERRPDKIKLLRKHQASEKKESSDRSTLPATILSTVLKLSLVLVLAYATILALKWMSDRRQIPLRIGREIRPMETIRLTPSSTLHVISVRGKNLLIGCSGNNMSLVCELEKDEGLEREETAQDRFIEYLARYSGERRENSPAVRIGGLLKDCAAYLRNRVHSRGVCHVENREE